MEGKLRGGSLDEPRDLDICNTMPMARTIEVVPPHPAHLLKTKSEVIHECILLLFTRTY